MDFTSCQAQFQTCQDFIQALNDRNLYWCGQHFNDEGQSVATLDRPAMRKLRKVVDLGGVEAYPPPWLETTLGANSQTLAIQNDIQ